MSDINKQARDKLKSAAAKAADNFDPNMFVETRDVLGLLDELDKWQQESSAWQAVAEMQLALATDAEKRIAELESLTAPRLPQPLPVSVPEVVGWEDVPEEITEDDIALASAWAHGFNQCRAAMLQGAEPVTDNTNQQFESLSRGDK